MPERAALRPLRWLASQAYYSGADYARAFERGPGWLLMRKTAQYDAARRLAAARRARTNGRSPVDDRPGVDRFESIEPVDVDQVVHALRVDGCHPGLTLRSEVVRAIVDYADRTECFGDRDRRRPLMLAERSDAEQRYGRRFRVASYASPERRCRSVERLASDPVLLEIARRHLGGPPVHQETQLWWSFARSGDETARLRRSQQFHYDLDDYRFVKFFFYLTDVDAGTGPHVCVRGTHLHKKMTHKIWRRPRPDGEIVSRYGEEAITVFEGPAGFGFAEDPLCFHKGVPPSERDRLIVMVEFASRSYGVAYGVR